MRIRTDGPAGVVVDTSGICHRSLCHLACLTKFFFYGFEQQQQQNLMKYSVPLWVGNLSSLFELGIASIEPQMLEYDPKSASSSSKSSGYTAKEAGFCVDSGPVYLTCKTRARRWQLNPAFFYLYPLSNDTRPGNQMITSVTNTYKCKRNQI